MSDIADQFAADAAAGSASGAQPQLHDQFAIDAGVIPTSKGTATTTQPYGSMTERLIAGFGHGMLATGQALRQGFDKGVNSLESAAKGTPIGDAADWLGSKLGMPTAAQSLAQTNAAIEQRHADAAPLLATKEGKLGDLLGRVASVAPTALIPGGQTYFGAGLIGAGTGLATTEGDVSDRLHGAMWGGAGGMAGKGFGDLLKLGIGKAASMRQDALSSAAAQNAQRDAAINLARQYGYKLPPQDVNPGPINAALEGISGKIKTSQAASQFNQDVTNRIVKSALGLTEDAALNPQTLQTIRQQAGQAYEAIRNTGTVTPGQAYFDALDKIAKQANGQAKSFPGLKSDQISDTLQTLKQSTFDASDAVDATRFMRNLADKAYAGGDKAAGAAYKQASTALEDALDSHLQALGNPDALGSFRAARQTIAKTYTVEKALNPTTGNVDAAKLAAQLNKEKPLSGGLKDVADLANAFPKSTQALKQNYNPISPLDYAVGLAGAMHNPAEAALVFGRPAVRSVILSNPVQSLNARAATDYSGGALSNLVYPTLTSRPLRDLLRIGGTVGAVNTAQQ